MEHRSGTFIVIEGTDGSGKGTQTELLSDRLKQAGYDVKFREFDGPHAVPPQIAREALEWFLK